MKKHTPSLQTRFAITTLGCKVNQFEGASLAQQLLEHGYQQTAFNSPADIYIINSCTVTSRSDRDTRRLVRRAHRINPTATIIVTGCYAQVAPQELAALPEVSQVIGNLDKQTFLELIQSGRSQVTPYGENTNDSPLPLTSYSDQTRAFLQIQNGCDAGCSYCIVPTARGKSRSVPYGPLVKTANDLVASGHRELVLTGIHIGAYGLDLTPISSLEELLKALLRDCSVERIRLGSLEPTELSNEILLAMASEPRLCKHLHIPLQSGSDRILSSMGRHYNRTFYGERIMKAHQKMPDAYIAADIIVGYPGETAQDFQDSMDLIQNLPICDLHVFPYSRRPGTQADLLPGHLAPDTIRGRVEQAQALRHEKHQAFLRGFIGKKLSVLGNRRLSDDGTLLGLSDNYISVQYPATNMACNQIRTVRIEGVDNQHLIGELV